MKLTASHLEVTVPDVARAVEFYRSVLGCREALREGDEWALVQCGPCDLAFRRGVAIHAPHFHFGFRLGSKEECEEAYHRLVASGVKIVHAYEDHGEWADFTVEDPNGYHVQLYVE